MNSEDDLDPDQMVYVHENWDVYHKRVGCAIGKGTDGGFGAIENMEKEDAIEEGYRACDSCVNNPWIGKEDKLEEIHGDKGDN